MVGDWAKAGKIASTMAARYKQAVERALMKFGQFLRAEVIKGITSGAPAGKAFAPLSPLTLAVRRFAGRGGGTKTLIASGALRQSIQVHRVAGGGVFVGILRTAAGKGGKAGANVGMIQEFGASWTHTMTDKQRRFLFAALKGSPYAKQGPRLPGGRYYSKSGGTITVRIPPRPFMGPIFEKFAKPEEVKKRFWNDVAEGMGFDLGKP